MSDAVEIVREVVGTIATGPAGFGIHFDVPGAFDPATGTATVELNKRSLARAEARIESANKDPAQTPEPSKPSPALTAISSQRDRMDTRYDGLFAKRGLQPSLDRILSSAPQFNPRRPNYRAMGKGPESRVGQRRLLALRNTLNQVKAQSTKRIGVNPETMPQSVLQKMLQDAVSVGASMTPVGPTAKIAKAAGLRAAYGRWGHALFPGSSPSVMAPRPS